MQFWYDQTMTERPIDALPQPSATDFDPLYTAKEAATYLGVSLRTIRTLTKDGTLPVVRLRSATNIRPGVRIRLSILNGYMEGNEL